MDERSVSSLRKIIFIVMLVLMTALCSSAMAKTEYSLAPAPAEVSIPDPGDNRAWAFVVNADAQVEKGNKAAGARARKAALELMKDLKEFRKVSVAEAKK